MNDKSLRLCLQWNSSIIRAKSADVISAIVENNPRSQQSVMEANGFESLMLNFTSGARCNIHEIDIRPSISILRGDIMNVVDLNSNASEISIIGKRSNQGQYLDGQ
ncbi:hypothetical protein YC2023_033882 [Brassica napus]